VLARGRGGQYFEKKLKQFKKNRQRRPQFSRGVVAAGGCGKGGWHAEVHPPFSFFLRHMRFFRGRHPAVHAICALTRKKRKKETFFSCQSAYAFKEEAFKDN